MLRATAFALLLCGSVAGEEPIPALTKRFGNERKDTLEMLKK